MDTQGQNVQQFVSNEHSHPIQLTQQLGEDPEQPLITQKVQCNINAQNQSIGFLALLSIYDTEYHLATEDANIDIRVQYRITSSLGTNGSALIIFVDSENRGGEEDQQEQGVQSVGDQLLKLIKSSQKGNFCLRGTCTATLIFETPQAMQHVYEKMSELVGEDDQGHSQYEDDEQMQQMICADDIDEDGNIIKDPHSQNQSSEEDNAQNNEMVDQQ